MPEDDRRADGHKSGLRTDQEVKMSESLPLQELIDFAELQDIQDGFSRTICASSVIFSLEGDALTRFSNPTRFCSLIQSTKEGMRRCFKSFMDMSQEALESDEPRLMHCFAHGAHFAAPITIDGERKATMFVGQFATEEFSPEKLKEIEEIAAKINVDPEQLVRAAKKMLVVSEDAILSYSTALSQIVEVIARLGAQAIELRRAKDVLQESHNNLETRVQERTAELAEANVVLKREIAERKLAEERIEHLNSVLKAIRNVNQLIMLEKDRGALLQKTCDILTEARGYDAAWFGLLGNGENFARFVGSGIGEAVTRFCEAVMREGHFPCIRDALSMKEMLVVVDRSIECSDCPFKGAYTGKATAIIHVKHAGRLYGLLMIALAADVDADTEERLLLREVASDIGFALHGIELEEAQRKADDALRESEEKYRALFETAKDAIFLADETGKFVDVNRAACESLGYEKEELLKMSNTEIDADPAGYEAFVKVWDGLAKEAKFEVKQRRKDGTLLPVEINGKIFESGGKQIYLAIARDVTERKRADKALRESEAKYRELVENANSIIVRMDTDGNVIFLNEFARRFFGYTDDELVGRNVVGTIVPETDTAGRNLAAMIRDIRDTRAKV
ncbi:MAG TPA: PAS domain S-box protein, partial [Methanosarcinales archaeon]|nr:PAS domain S-box protein [Methanosarcinales archaeon]